MNTIELFLAEMAKLKDKKVVLYIVIAILLVPIIYIALTLSAKSDGHIPVAIVNEDKGAQLFGEPINFGEDLVGDLKNDETLKPTIVTAKDAQDGLKKMKYYMVIEIPEAFSENVTTVLDETPTSAELKYIQNQDLDHNAAKTTEAAIENIRSQLASKVINKYANYVFDQLEIAASGFEGSATSHDTLYEGTAKLKDGSEKVLTSLLDGTEGIEKLASGSQELEAGAGEMRKSLVDGQAGVSQLATGSKQLSDGTGALLKALQSQSGDIGKLADGAKSLHAGTQSLSSGAAEVLEGLEASKAGSGVLKGGLTELHTGSKALVSGFNQVLEAAPQLAPYLTDLKAGAESLSNNLSPESNFGAGLTQLDNGLGQLVAGQTSISKGAKDLVDGAGGISAGNQGVKAGWDEITNSVQALHAGATKITEGNKGVADGWRALTEGSTAIHEGLKGVSEGNVGVKEGWHALSEGMTSIDGGLEMVQLGNDGLMATLKYGQRSTAELLADDENIAMFASPIKIDGEIITSEARDRNANAPLILSLTLLIGVIAMSFAVQFHEPVVTPASGFSWFAGKVMKLTLLAVLQAILVALYALFVLKLQVDNSFMFIIFSIGVSLTFLMFVLFLIAIAGNVGRMIALAFLILQVSTVGFSLPTVPMFARSLNDFLPVTYSIGGFKSIISSLSGLWSHSFILLIYLVVFAVLSLSVFIYKFKQESIPSNVIE